MNNLDETLRKQECEGSKHYVDAPFAYVYTWDTCAFCGQSFRIDTNNQFPPHYVRSV